MASRSFFADINLDQNELQFAVLHSLASAPSSGTEVEGQVYYDTGSNTPFFWNGSAWTSMSSAAASSVPWSGVTSGTNTNQTLVVGSNTIFLIGDGTLEFEGAGAGDMTLGTNLTGATDRTVNLPDVSATSTLIASSDTPAADQFVVATGSTEGIVEYRVIANSDIAGILALDDLTDVVITTPANPSYLRYNGSNWIDVTAATVASDVNGSLDHGSLTGLTDDDHSQYVYDSPASSSRNLVTAANATTIPLTLRGASSHSAELFVVENSGGTDLFFIAADGDLTARGSIKGGGSAGTADSTAFILDNSGIGGGPRTFTFPNASGEIVTTSAAQNISGTKTFGSQDIRFESIVSSSHGWTFSTSKAAGNFDILTIPPITTAATLLATADGSVTAGEFAVASNTTVGEITFRDLQSSDLPAISLDDLSDVVITTPANPSYLRYNGSNWIDVAESQILTDIESSIDHGSISGLGDDDHTQYIITSPSVSTRNVIESSSNSLVGLSLEYDVASAPGSYRPWFEILGQTALAANLFSVGIGASDYQVLITDATLTVDGASTFGSTVVINGVTTHNARVDIDDNSTVRFYDDDDSNYVAIDVPSAVTSNYTLTFPDAGPPGANYVLMADASGDFSWVDGSGVAVSDHGSLSGLGDDDHTQYHTDARALTWLGTRSTSDLPEGTNLYFTDERVDDRVASLIQNGTGISWSYNDGAGTLTPTVSISSFSLGDLSDVDTSGASTNDLLQLNGSGDWVPVDPSTVGVTDHGNLSGLGDDDHTQYIIDAPNSGRDNTITPSDNTTGLILRGPTGAADVFLITDNAGSNELFVLDSNSDIQFAGDQIFFNHNDGTDGGYILITRSSTGVGGYIDLSTSGSGAGGYIAADTNGAQDAGFLNMNSNGSSRGGNIDLGAAIGTSSERSGQWTATAGTGGRGGDLIMDGSNEDAGDIDTSGGSANGKGGSILTYGGFAASGSPTLRGGNIYTFGSNSTSGNTRGGDILTNSVASSGNRGGDIITQSGAGGRGGDINTSGGSSSGQGGDIDTSGGTAANGGNINTSGGVAGAGGSIDLSGSTTGSGGSIDLSAGSLVDGGSLDMSGGSVAGGDITTSNGGGSINTNAGTIELGVAATRVTLQKSATAARTVTFIDQTGSVPVFASAPGSADLFVLSDNTTGGIKFATRAISSLSDVDTSGASTNDLLQLNGSGIWVPVDPSTVGVTDHGSLSGLSDDDHTQYIIDDPGNDTRNVIASTTDDVVSLTLTASGNSGSATFDIFRVEDSANTALFTVDDTNGQFFARFGTGLDGVVSVAPVSIVNSTLALFNGSSQFVALQAPGTLTSWTFTLPQSDGSSGQFLQTNGSGVTSWATALTSVALDDLTDVVITTPANPSYLRYNGSNWIDVAASQIVTDIESSIDHGSISGLADDDHSQYITDAPTNDTRNQIVGSVGQRMLIDAVNGTGGTYNATEGNTIFRVRTNATDDYLRVNAFTNTAMAMQLNANNFQLHNNTPIIFKSGTTNAANGVSLRASGTISSSYTITLPGSGPAASGNILYNTGSGTMAWGSHNNLSGLATGDPHTQYVSTAPATSARNLITAGNSTTIPLTVRGNATQAVDIFVVENSGGTNYLTIDNGGDATFSQDVTITGDLTVNGTTTTVNTTELIVEDNIIVVNSAGTVQNAGLEVERGASANASIFYNETSDEWFVDNASVSLQIARKYVDTSTIVGDSTTDTWDITHNMGTSDVIAVVYDSSDNQVETEIVITDSNTVTVNFAKPPATSVTYRVVVVG